MHEECEVPKLPRCKPSRRAPPSAFCCTAPRQLQRCLSDACAQTRKDGRLPTRSGFDGACRVRPRSSRCQHMHEECALPKLPRYKPSRSPTLSLLFDTPRQLQRCLSDACAQTRQNGRLSPPVLDSLSAAVRRRRGRWMVRAEIACNADAAGKFAFSEAWRDVCAPSTPTPRALRSVGGEPADRPLPRSL